MSTKTKVLVVSAVLAALGGMAFSFRPIPQGVGSGACLMASTESFQVTAVSDLHAEANAITSAYLKGLPPPSGTSRESEGKVSWTNTGLTSAPTGEPLVLCRLTDEIADVSYANLFLDGSLVVTANRQNGLIVDRGAKAIVSVPVHIPASGLFELRIEWFSDTGVAREATHGEFSH